MFYFLRQDLFKAQGIIEIVGHSDETSRYSWVSGARFPNAPPPITLDLDPGYGERLPAFFDTTVPVMSADLRLALRAAGVDNFDEYPVILRRIDSGEEFQGYSAVNIIGCRDAVDLEDSEYRLRFGKPYFTGRLSIDPNGAQGLKAFRLLHGPGFVVVSEEVAEALMPMGFVGLLLQPTTDYSGT